MLGIAMPAPSAPLVTWLGLARRPLRGGSPRKLMCTDFVGVFALKLVYRFVCSVPITKRFLSAKPSSKGLPKHDQAQCCCSLPFDRAVRIAQFGRTLPAGEASPRAIPGELAERSRLRSQPTSSETRFPDPPGPQEWKLNKNHWLVEASLPSYFQSGPFI